ncbi:carbamate kinase [Proteinivorax hydrogeniformans]|uniref:Carbamate kinase n=1 Tax=Proteinivorax hydrogeniformans TaxID=1826727 RepID=A0AAU8HU68_9FIRM
MGKFVVIALGGNAILQPKQKGTADTQYQNIYATCEHIATLLKSGYKVLLTHGNGPQVGNILLQQDEAKDVVSPMPLDVCGSMSQGFIGYMFQRAMRNVLKKNNMDKEVTTLVTQVKVDKNDPAFENPTKPIGPFYTEDEAKELMTKGYDMIEDSGRGWRRVVPSPNPIGVMEEKSILQLIENDNLVIASGGGGIPVVEGETLEGIEAVIDKDLAGQKLAMDVKADSFVILTDVDYVFINYNTPQQEKLGKITVAEIEKLVEEGHFKAGSMGPKVEAAIKFAKATGQPAIIASLNSVLDALEHKSGTIIVPE